MARLVVSIQTLQILASDKRIFMVLGYHPHELNGQSILVLTGARSDKRMLQSAIQAMEEDKMQFTFYDNSSDERCLIVSFTPFLEAGLFVGSTLTLQPSEATTLQEAFQDCLYPRVLASADSPHAIHMANDALLDCFACSRSEVLGRPLHLFSHYSKQHFIDNSPSNEPEAAWSALVCVALDGRVARRQSTAGSDIYDVICVPVVEAPNGRIRHFLVTFGSPVCGDDDGAKESRSDGRPLQNADHAAKGRPALKSAGARVSNASSSPELCRPGFTIVPRRKVQTDSPPTAVVVTRELVAALADLPIQQAAAAAGVSATAFKRACRGLGICQWAYKRRRTRTADPATAASYISATAADTSSAGQGGGQAEDDLESGADFQCNHDWSTGMDHSPWPHLRGSDDPLYEAPDNYDDASDLAFAMAHAGCISGTTGANTGLTPPWAAGACTPPFNGGSAKSSATSVAAGGQQQLWEMPAVDDALVREMLGVQWTLQAWPA